jgi:hypothetical protein
MNAPPPANNIFVAVNVSPDLDPSGRIILGLPDAAVEEAGPTGAIEIDLRPAGLSLIVTIIRDVDLEALAEKARGMPGQFASPPASELN